MTTRSVSSGPPGGRPPQVMLVWALAVLLLLGACQSEDEPSAPQAGSESHFLEICQASCSEGFECLCGVCTQSCSDDATCVALDAAAECVAVADRPAESACTDAGVAAFCDVPCTGDAGCVSLGAGFTCSAGFCREGVPTANGRIEVQDLCAFYVNDICRAGIGCYDWEYESQEHCLANWDCSGRTELDILLAEGRVSYDAAAAYACHQALLADPCALGFFLFSPTLSEALLRCDALIAHLDEGAECRSVDCKEGLLCDYGEDGLCPGVCQPPEPPLPENQPVGGACVTTICLDGSDPCGQCASGLICFNDLCHETWAPGVPCSEANECLLDYWCDRTIGQCVPLAKLGEPCRDFALDEEAPPCEEGLWCDTLPFETGVCVEFNGAGGLCVQDEGCLDELPCMPGTVDDPLGRGRCAAPRPDGGDCNSDDDCVSGYCELTTEPAVVQACAPKPAPGEPCSRICAEGSTCTAQVCLADRRLGEPCDALSGCIDSRCDGATCVPMKRLDEPCTDSTECALSYCLNGVCAEQARCE